MTSAFDPVRLPCGRILPNRCVKAAMYEHLGNFGGGIPNERYFALYSVWAKYGWGMVITGHVQVSTSHLGLGRELVISPKSFEPTTFSEETLSAYKRLSQAARGRSAINEGEHTPLVLVQINHTGRQSSNLLGGRPPFVPPLAPSAVRVGSEKRLSLWSKLFYSMMFQEPKAMSLQDIDEVVDQFANGAELALQSGFDGVQVHAAHGYLLTQFMSPKTNKRQDEYSPEGALLLIKRIIFAIRAKVPQDFVVGIKINSADYAANSEGPSTINSDAEIERRALNDFLTISQWDGVDFIELSGGDYENPKFVTTVSSKIKRNQSLRQAIFSRFASHAMKALDALSSSNNSGKPPRRPLVLLTGGLRTPGVIASVLSNRHADLLGFGRTAVTSPDLPLALKAAFDSSRVQQQQQLAVADDPLRREPGPLPKVLWSIPLVGASAELAWYTYAIRRLSDAQIELERGKGKGKEALGDTTGEMQLETVLPYGVGTGAMAYVYLWLTPGEQRVVGGYLLLTCFPLVVIALSITALSK